MLAKDKPQYLTLTYHLLSTKAQGMSFHAVDFSKDF
jgi:hypothetical protein